MVILLLLVVGVAAIYFVVRRKRKRERAALVDEAQRFAAAINEHSGMQAIEIPGLLLAGGEKALLSESSTLSETRAVRRSVGYGGGFRAMKGVYIGRGSSESRSYQKLQTLDKGTLTLTTKRLIFDGSQETRSVTLGKVLSVSPWRNAIELAVEGRQKSMVLAARNPLIWALGIQIATREPHPEKLDHQVSIKI